ncbi:unnamed protein product [Cuscuta campestris]|uniref:Uncharacterized protein n=1 Tax=Cuscuta campestris TaxID=132261 RepID=A0A484M0C1_9ASTE|nr:unnamed protein product [Cuscuta campestris]
MSNIIIPIFQHGIRATALGDLKKRSLLPPPPPVILATVAPPYSPLFSFPSLSSNQLLHSNEKKKKKTLVEIIQKKKLSKKELLFCHLHGSSKKNPTPHKLSQIVLSSQKKGKTKTIVVSL